MHLSKFLKGGVTMGETEREEDRERKKGGRKGGKEGEKASKFLGSHQMTTIVGAGTG